MTQWDGFPTPETIPTTKTLRLIAIPDDRAYIAAVGGALHRLTDPNEWKAVGAVTPDEVAYDALLMVRDYWEKTMVGVIIPYMTAQPPPYTLACEGGQFYRTDYPFLYAALDPAFIDNSDQFTLPDLRGKTILGANGTGGLAVGATGGEAEHTLSESEMPTHTHTDAGHTHAEGNALPATFSIIPPDLFPGAIPGAGLTGAGFASIQPTGGNQPHNNLPPYLAVKYAVFYA